MAKKALLPINDNGVVQLDGVEFLTAVTGLTPITIYADNHTVEAHELMSSQEVIEGQAKNGIKLRYMEVPQDYQKFVDAYNIGGATATDESGSTRPIDDKYIFDLFDDGYASSANSSRIAQTHVNTLKHSKKEDINVVFYDKNPEVFETMPEMRKIYGNFLNIADEQGSEQADIYLKNLPAETQKEYNKFQLVFSQQRFDENYRIAREVKDKAGVVLSIGSGHIERNKLKDLDELIGEDKVTSVVFFENVNDTYYKTIYEESLDLPDYFYFIEEGKAIVPPQHDKSLLCEIPLIGSILADCGVQSVNLDSLDYDKHNISRQQDTYQQR